MTSEEKDGQDTLSGAGSDPEGPTWADRDVSGGPLPFSSVEPGDVLAGRYRILELLGQGAMGMVFEAEDRDLGGRVALKLLRPELARDARTEDRFRREVHLARKVTHPNVCRIYDLGRHRDEANDRELVFLTMELLRGLPLSHRLSLEGPLPLERALELAEPIAAALDAAHAAGVIHRDFKGANVVLAPGPEGDRVVVTDFGLSRSLDEADPQRLTATGKILGTPAFIAPEQLTDEPITPAVDIYAFGVLLFQMVTGELPFSGGGPLAAALRRLKEPPPDPTTLRPDLPKSWSRTILRCLARDPAERFASAAAVVDALREPPAIEPPPEATRAPPEPPVLRHAARWLVGAIVVTLGITLGWLAGRSPRPEPAPPPATAPTDRPTVALTGFTAPGADDPWLAEVATELLRRELSAGDRVRMAPAFEASNPAVLVLEGDYRRPDPSTLELEARLRRGDETLARESVRGPEGSVLDLVSQLARDVRGALSLDPSPEDLAAARAARPPDPEAARAYGAGLAALHELRLGEARSNLERAVDLRPDFPVAWAALAEAYQESGMDARARQAATEAKERSGDLSRRDQLLIDARFREARAEWNEARGIHEALLRFYPDEPEHAVDLARAALRSGYAADALAALQAWGEPHRDDPRVLLALGELFEGLGRLDEAREAAERSAERADDLAAWNLHGRSLLLIAHVMRVQGDLDGAAATLDRAQQSFERARDPKGRADATAGRSRVDQARGDYDVALDDLANARELYREIGDEAGIADTWLSEGLIARRKGDLARAGELYEKSRARYEELGHFNGTYMALRNLAILRSIEGDPDAARRMFEEALEVAQATGNRAYVAAAQNNLAIVLSDAGEQRRAAELYEKALRGFRDVGDLDGAGSALNNLAILRWDAGELAGASQAYEKALEIYREMRDPSGQALVEANLAELWRDRGDAARAASLFADALHRQESIGETAAAAKTRALVALLDLDRGRAHAAAGDAENAAHALEELPDDAALAWAVTALSRFADGRPEEAAKAFEEASRRADDRENPAVALWIAIGRARTITRAGDPAAAADRLEELADRAARAEIRRLELVARRAAAEAARESGDEDRARRLARAAEQGAEAIGFRSPEMRPGWPEPPP